MKKLSLALSAMMLIGGLGLAAACGSDPDAQRMQSWAKQQQSPLPNAPAKSYVAPTAPGIVGGAQFRNGAQIHGSAGPGGVSGSVTFPNGTGIHGSGGPGHISGGMTVPF